MATSTVGYPSHSAPIYAFCVRLEVTYGVAAGWACCEFAGLAVSFSVPPGAAAWRGATLIVQVAAGVWG